MGKQIFVEFCHTSFCRIQEHSKKSTLVLLQRRTSGEILPFPTPYLVRFSRNMAALLAPAGNSVALLLLGPK